MLPAPGWAWSVQFPREAGTGTPGGPGTQLGSQVQEQTVAEFLHLVLKIRETLVLCAIGASLSASTEAQQNFPCPWECSAFSPSDAAAAGRMWLLSTGSAPMGTKELNFSLSLILTVLNSHMWLVAAHWTARPETHPSRVAIGFVDFPGQQ